MEITLEINPEEVTLEKMKNFKDMGINRISLGVQSFDNKLLKILQRTHTFKEAIKAIEIISLSKIKNISCDLMYDIPYQTLKSFKETLKTVKNLPLTHISLYNLTFEKNTPFYKNKQKLSKSLSNKKSFDFLKTAITFFKENNFHHYAISAYAREKKFFSKHNLGYWKARPFLGFGPSAFSYFNGKRFKNTPNLQKYFNLLKMGKKTISFEEKLKYPNNIKELLIINLRIIEGISLKTFQKLHGTLPKKTLKTISELSLQGFLKIKNGKIKLLEKGFFFYDYVAELLI
jgi:oxygen-independent coproporphyrinogen-3 oxidase